MVRTGVLLSACFAPTCCEDVSRGAGVYITSISTDLLSTFYPTIAPKINAGLALRTGPIASEPTDTAHCYTVL